MDDHRRTPRVFVHEEVLFADTSLSQLVAQAGCELVFDPSWGDLDRALDSTPPPLDLIILMLRSGSSVALEPVATLRRRDWLTTIPILVISPLDVSDLDLWQLRALGVIGLISSKAPPENVRFRIGEVAYKGRDGRRFERAPCCLPVEVEADGETSTDYAVSLSVGGVGLATSRRIEPNTLVSLRFSLEEGQEPITVPGRTVHIREVQREGANYQVGVFFYRLDEILHRKLSVAVHHLLSAWNAIGVTMVAEDGSTSTEIDQSHSFRTREGSNG